MEKNNINKVIGGNNNKTTHIQLKTENQTFNDGDDISNAFGEYFSTIGQKLSDKIPAKHDDHPNKINTLTESTSSIFLRPASVNEVEMLISALRVNKACGIDDISAMTMKNCACVISPILSKLINLCFETSQYPNGLKVAKVVPIYKSGDRDKVENYRPISVLRILNNIIERAIYNRLLLFLESTKFFYDQQHGFRPKHSTNIAIIEIVDMLNRELNAKKTPTALFMDLSKAFGCVNHIILLHKLGKAGIRGIALQLFESYLTDRQMKVKANGIVGRSFDLKIGVPQGSILGPILYTHQVNDLANLQLQGNARLFADDTSIFYTQPTTQQNMNSLENDIKLIDEYYRLNKLTVNLSKTELIHFHSNKRAMPSTHTITYKGTCIENVSSVKHLGLIFDSQLQWKSHIDKLAKKLASIVGIFTKISKFLPTHVMLLLYFALFHSRIDYASACWTTATKTQSKLLYQSNQ